MDLFIGAGCLAGELVAREVEDLKALVPEFFVILFQFLILRCEPAACRGIHDEKDLAFKIAQGLLGAILFFNSEIIDIHSDLLSMESLTHFISILYNLIVRNLIDL